MRKITVVTGTRAEYGLLQPLLKELRSRPDVCLQLLVTGAHLSPEFGMTVQEIEADGYTVDARVEMLLSSDSPVGIAKSVGLGVTGFADALARLAPDLVIVLGDRYEILAAAQTAMLLRIPLAHLHGGELTEGAIDDAIRHAITKMSQLHFVAAEAYRRRVMQLGESGAFVHNVGMTGLDHLTSVEWMSRQQLSDSLAFEIPAKFFLVTYHPVTLADVPPAVPFAQLLQALDAFPDYGVVMTRPNADAHGRVLFGMIDEYVRGRTNVAAVTSLGSRRYLSMVREATLVIGNSSSGLTEAPAIGTPTINIGDRQKGRLRAASVLDCAEHSADIEATIRRGLAADWRASLKTMIPVYGSSGASRKIADIVCTIDLAQLKTKQFVDA